MKLFNKLSTFALAAVIGFTSCEKAKDLPSYADGTAPVLSTPSATVAPPVADSNKVSVILNWTDPKFASDPKTFKYIIEIDSAGRNFSKAYTKTIIGKLTDSTIAKEFNAVMLAWGFEFNKAYDVDVRVTASYGNNNEQKRSNILKLRATPYKIPPKVALPPSGRLFIVGGATNGGWNNPVPVPSQELARYDETTWGGVFQLSGGNEYLILPVNGSWDNKFAIPSNLAPGIDVAGTFFASTGPGDNFKAPPASGLYKITLDFQKGLYTVAPNFTSGQAYLLLPVNGSWAQKYGADNPSPTGPQLGGKIKGEGADIPAPSVSGSYKFTVDFYTGEYKLTQ